MSSLFIKHNSKHAQKKTIGSIICLKKPKNDQFIMACQRLPYK